MKRLCKLGAQDYVKAEAVAREMLSAAPRLQEAKIILGRALLGQNKLDEAEKIFRAAVNEPCYSPPRWRGQHRFG